MRLYSSRDKAVEKMKKIKIEAEVQQVTIFQMHGGRKVIRGSYTGELTGRSEIFDSCAAGVTTVDAREELQSLIENEAWREAKQIIDLLEQGHKEVDLVVEDWNGTRVRYTPVGKEDDLKIKIEALKNGLTPLQNEKEIYISAYDSATGNYHGTTVNVVNFDTENPDWAKVWNSLSEEDKQLFISICGDEPEFELVK